jgi:hypothetical protein
MAWLQCALACFVARPFGRLSLSTRPLNEALQGGRVKQKKRRDYGTWFLMIGVPLLYILIGLLGHYLNIAIIHAPPG